MEAPTFSIFYPWLLQRNEPKWSVGLCRQQASNVHGCNHPEKQSRPRRSLCFDRCFGSVQSVGERLGVTVWNRSGVWSGFLESGSLVGHKLQPLRLQNEGNPVREHSSLKDCLRLMAKCPYLIYFNYFVKTVQGWILKQLLIKQNSANGAKPETFFFFTQSLESVIYCTSQYIERIHILPID